jgi:hypothetical protein
VNRTLSLKRTVLHELTADELGAVGGADGSISCLDYLSCNPLDCVLRYTLIVRTIVTE